MPALLLGTRHVGPEAVVRQLEARLACLVRRRSEIARLLKGKHLAALGGVLRRGFQLVLDLLSLGGERALLCNDGGLLDVVHRPYGCVVVGTPEDVFVSVDVGLVDARLAAGRRVRLIRALDGSLEAALALQAIVELVHRLLALNHHQRQLSVVDVGQGPLTVRVLSDLPQRPSVPIDVPLGRQVVLYQKICYVEFFAQHGRHVRCELLERVLHLGLLRGDSLQHAPAHQFVDVLRVAPPDRDVHAGVAVLILSEDVQPVVEQVLQDVHVAAEGAQV